MARRPCWANELVPFRTSFSLFCGIYFGIQVGDVRPLLCTVSAKFWIGRATLVDSYDTEDGKAARHAKRRR